MSIREKLKKKIKADTGFEVGEGKLYRHNLSWAHATAGRMKWYWLVDGVCVGSAENMRELLNSDKITIDQTNFGFVEFSSS